MAIKRYIPGSETTPSDLNEIQDDYIKSGYERWLTIGSSAFNAFSSTVAGNLYSSLGFFGTLYTTSSNNPLWCRLDPADYANSYNGSLRTRQLRFVVVCRTDLVAIGDRLQEIALRSITTTATANTWTYGTKLGTVVIPSLTNPRASYRFEGSAFTFPAAGQYVVEIQLRAQGATVPNVGVTGHIILQTRAI
jgi:hypothetical protein